MAHGSELQLQVFSGASWVTLAELTEVDYDADESLEAVQILGSRLNGYRRGRFAVSGTIKGYWINGGLRAMLLGQSTINDAAGSGISTVGYESQAGFTRYQIQVVPVSASFPPVAPPKMTFVNVTLGKDTVTWTADKLTTESISFYAEDILGF